MPIRGLTDRRAALPRLGILRKGAAKPSAQQPGADLTYFRFVPEDASLLPQFEQAYGPQPRELAVRLPYATADEVLTAWQEQWRAGGLVHRCDGQTCTLWQDRDGAYQHEPRPCPGGCSPVGRMDVLLPALQRLAVVTVLSSSIHDIRTLHETLGWLESVSPHGLRGLPCLLRRRARKISIPAAQGRRRQEKWLLGLEPSPEWVTLEWERMQRQQEALPTPAVSAVPLPAPEETAAVAHGPALVDERPVPAPAPEEAAPEEAAPPPPSNAEAPAPPAAPPTDTPAPADAPVAASPQNGVRLTHQALVARYEAKARALGVVPEPVAPQELTKGGLAGLAARLADRPPACPPCLAQDQFVVGTEQYGEHHLCFTHWADAVQQDGAAARPAGYAG